MIDHVTLRVSDYEKSKEFFSRALKPLGYVLTREFPKDFSAGFAADGRRDLWIKAGSTDQRSHSFSCLAFVARSKQAVNDFYKAALDAGGQDNGAPGYRPEYHPGYYAAFVLDPDGYNIEAVFDEGGYPE